MEAGEEWLEGDSLEALVNELARRLIASGKKSIRATDYVFTIEHEGARVEFTTDITCRRLASGAARG
jgi:hypothetical protein